jgi:hypothetical protein
VRGLGLDLGVQEQPARSLPVLHPPTSYARRASSAPLVGEPRRATPPLLRHRPVSCAVCPSLDSPVDEQWGFVPPSTHQPTTLVVAAVAGAGARGSAQGRSTLAAAIGGGAGMLLPPPRVRAAELNLGRHRRGREGSSCRRGQAARGESSHLMF